MKIEIPQFRRCCFCVPLRYGLLVYSYLTLVPLTICLVISSSSVTFERYRFEFALQTIFIVSFVLRAVHYGLTFILIVALHMKCPKLLKMYYVFALVLSFTGTILMISSFVYFVYNLWEWTWIWGMILVKHLIQLIYIGVQLFIIVLVRSETLKLKTESSKTEEQQTQTVENTEIIEMENMV